MTRADIEAVILVEPTLTADGVGGWSRRLGMTQEQWSERWPRERECLLNSEHICTLVCEWLSTVEKIKSLNHRSSSYSLKHWVEEAIREYVSNGQLICAAIHCGFKYENCRNAGPTVIFNMSHQSLKKQKGYPVYG